LKGHVGYITVVPIGLHINES